MIVLTQKQGYAAMFQFLEDYWMRTKSDEMGGLLGAMSLLANGSPADAAMAHDWRFSSCITGTCRLTPMR